MNPYHYWLPLFALATLVLLVDRRRPIAPAGFKRGGVFPPTRSLPPPAALPQPGVPTMDLLERPRLRPTLIYRLARALLPQRRWMAFVTWWWGRHGD